MWRVVIICTIISNCAIAQNTFFNANLWDLIYADEFNGSKRSEWRTLDPQQPWGDQTFSPDPKYTSFGVDGTRSYLSLNAYVENVNGSLKNISGGIQIDEKIWDNNLGSILNPSNPFYYGYYEIEAKLAIGSQGLANNGMWPAFWFVHSGENSPGNIWYEEVDIFEPGACYIKDGRDVVHYWTNMSSNALDPRWNGQGFEGERVVDMFSWHRYGLMWLPDRLVFYYDDVPFHVCMTRVPSHQKPAMLLDLQTSDTCNHTKVSGNQYIGSFEINYFRYYERKSCSPPITETMGNGYNFSTWVNSTANVKPYCIFKNTSIPANGNVQVFSEDVFLKNDFEVPLGATFEVALEYCD